MTNVCNVCGLCCKLFYINITRSEFASGKFKAESHGSGLFLLEKQSNGSCIYQVDNRCVIHNSRPSVCRQFFCCTKAAKYQEMVKVIDEFLQTCSPAP